MEYERSAIGENNGQAHHPVACRAVLERGRPRRVGRHRAAHERTVEGWRWWVPEAVRCQRCLQSAQGDAGSDARESLFAVGTEASVLVTGEDLAGLRDTAVTRLFFDPTIDPDSGDVFGTILRLGSVQ